MVYCYQAVNSNLTDKDELFAFGVRYSVRKVCLDRDWNKFDIKCFLKYFVEFNLIHFEGRQSDMIVKKSYLFLNRTGFSVLVLSST